ncbi:N-acetylmuramoyl-L-alanine amidase [Streptomyces sp. NPDC047821]|uniref:N-acetylmuramoyl-L-alanine amidase n=1 Tax=Streptomyces sp. NPDC047821 TaxID=3365488 RepID=UPI0037227BE4
MATPLTADQLLAALRAEGVRVQEHAGWRTNNRNHRGAWGPIHGVMIHHTVTSGTASSVELCFNGHSTLPGPLCHGVIAKDGVIHLVGNGRANHAGSGDGDVLQAVINEQPLPADNEADTDGNRHFYGFEAINLGDGSDPWPAAQLDAIERASAAICRAHGWSHRSVIRHLDWQPGKVDPRGVDWPAMQARIADRLGSTPTQPPVQEEPDMTPEQAKQLATAASQINTVYNERRLYSWGYKNVNVDPRDVYGVLTDIDKRVKALEATGLTDAQMTTLADKVADALARRLAE